MPYKQTLTIVVSPEISMEYKIRSRMEVEAQITTAKTLCMIKGKAIK